MEFEHHSLTGPLYFYGGPFSNFTASPFFVKPLAIGSMDYAVLCDKSLEFKTVEHWFAAHKASDEADFLLIAGAPGPGTAKSLGRSTELRPDWEEVKYPIMVQGLRYKYMEPPVFRKALLDTGDRAIAEDSPTDAVWGITSYQQPQDLAPNRKPRFIGANLLGLGLMQVRAEINGAVPEEALQEAQTLQRATWPEHRELELTLA